MTITSKPSLYSASTTAEFRFESNLPGYNTFICQLDQTNWAACDSPKTYSNLSEGEHAFYVDAVDSTGRATGYFPWHQWNVDLIPTETNLITYPPAHSKSPTATFSFDSNEPATFECGLHALGSFNWSPCTSPKEFTGLSEGLYLVGIRAVDTAGNRDPSPIYHYFEVDWTAPVSYLYMGGPASSSNQTSVTIMPRCSNESYGGGCTFDCSLDGVNLATCDDPSFSGLEEGTHLFTYRATDAAGNVEFSSNTFTWVIDVTPPETSITSAPPAKTSHSSASFTFNTSEPGGTFLCTYSGGSLTSVRDAPCTSPLTLSNLAPAYYGYHFRVHAVDAAGNADPTVAVVDWEVTNYPIATFEPAWGVTGVELVPTIRVTFDQLLNCSTVTGSSLRLFGPSGASVTGTLQCAGAVATFQPSSSLPFGSLHWIELEDTISDTTGRMSLAQGSYFTTRDLRWSSPVRIDAGQSVALVPRMATNASGQTVAVWSENSSGYCGTLWVNRYDPTNGWGTAEQITTPIIRPDGCLWQSSYSVAIDASGNALVAWVQTTGSFGIQAWANLYSATHGWDPATRIRLDTSGPQSWNPSVAMNGAGDAMVVWTRDKVCGGTASCDSVISRRYSAATGSWGNMSGALDSSSYDTYRPKVVIDDSGVATVIWEEANSSAPTPLVRDIKSLRIQPGGQFSSIVAIRNLSWGIVDTRIAGEPSGEVAVAWLECVTYACTSRAASIKPRLNGPGWLSEVSLSQNDIDSIGEIALDSSGNVFVPWVENSSDTYVARWDAGTRLLGNPRLTIQGVEPVTGIDAANNLTVASNVESSERFAGSGAWGLPRSVPAILGVNLQLERYGTDPANGILIWQENSPTGGIWFSHLE